MGRMDDVEDTEQLAPEQIVLPGGSELVVDNEDDQDDVEDDDDDGAPEFLAISVSKDWQGP